MKRKTLESSNPFRHTPPRCFQLGCCCRTECSTVGSTPQVCRRGRETLYWSWVILQRFFSGKLRVLPLFEFWWKHSPSISWLDARQGRKPVEMMIRSEALASVGWTSSSMTGARHVFFWYFDKPLRAVINQPGFHGMECHSWVLLPTSQIEDWTSVTLLRFYG